MTTKTKIVLAFMLISLLNFSPVFIRIQESEKVQDHIKVLLESNLYEHEGISQLAYFLQRTKSNLRELLLEAKHRPNKNELAHAKEAILESISGLEHNMIVLSKATQKGKDLDSYNDRNQSNSEIKKVALIKSNLNKFIEGASELLAVAQNTNDVNYYLAIFVNTVEPASRVLQQQINEFKVEEFKEVQHELQEIATHSQSMMKYILFCSATTFFLSIIIGLFFARSFTQTYPNTKNTKNTDDH